MSLDLKYARWGRINRVDIFLFIIYNVTQRNRPRNIGTIDCVWNKNISWWHFDIRHLFIYLLIFIRPRLAYFRSSDISDIRMEAVSSISYILLYDWSCHLREQINRTFQFRNCHRKFFCSFRCIHGNNPRTVSVWGKRLHKNVLAQANAIYTWVKELV